MLKMCKVMMFNIRMCRVQLLGHASVQCEYRCEGALRCKSSPAPKDDRDVNQLSMQRCLLPSDRRSIVIALWKERRRPAVKQPGAAVICDDATSGGVLLTSGELGEDVTVPPVTKDPRPGAPIRSPDRIGAGRPQCPVASATPLYDGEETGNEVVVAPLFDH